MWVEESRGCDSAVMVAETEIVDIDIDSVRNGEE